ncbi:MAG: hypothetical protein Q7J28_06450 [Caulobacter sp.]|nr:hypothetical protein [Caulobacter sp.]
MNDAIREPLESDRQAADSVARLAQRATVQFFLDTAELLSRAIDADTVRGLIFLGIVSANTRHLSPGSPEGQAYAAKADVAPDSVKRGISVHALSHQVNLPYETTRRHVQRLITEGLCERRADGIIVRAAALSNPGMMRILDRNLANVFKFIDALEDGGVLAIRRARGA